MTNHHPSYDFIAIGGSSGALKALDGLLPALNHRFTVPIGIVLHRLAEGGNGLQKVIQNKTSLPVLEPKDKTEIRPSFIYLAPANYHLLIESNRSFSLSYDEAVYYSRPSIDVLFETAADTYGERLVIVILSGANHDGCQGAEYAYRLGAKVMVQSPNDAETPIMPEAALKKTTPHFQGTAPEIAQHLNQLNYGRH